MKKFPPILLLALSAATSPTFAQTPPDTQPIMTNPNLALTHEISSLTANPITFDKVAKIFAEVENCNLVVNWRALELAGITRSTPVYFSLHNTTLAEALRDLFEATPTTSGKLNYSIAAGVIVITTNAELGKTTTLKFIDLSPQLSLAFDPATGETGRQALADILLATLRTELLSAGESLTGNNRDMLLKGDMLAVTQSTRAFIHIEKNLQLFLAPTPPNATPMQVRLSPAAKKTDDTLNALLGNPDHPIPFAILAKDPQKYLPNISTVLLPTTSDELAKPNPNLDYEITPGGTLLIGPTTTIHNRTSLAIYDLRPFIRRQAQLPHRNHAPTPADITTAIINTLKSKVPADWGDLEKSPNSITPYGQSLIIFTTDRTHRAIATTLQDLYK